MQIMINVPAAFVRDLKAAATASGVELLVPIPQIVRRIILNELDVMEIYEDFDLFINEDTMLAGYFRRLGEDDE